MPVAADELAWLQQHMAELRLQIDKLTKVALKPGKGGAEKAKNASDMADKLERRFSRLLRGAANLDNQEERKRQRAKRLAKSKAPRDRIEVVLGALDELPVDLAIEVAEEALRRARKRAGGDSE